MYTETHCARVHVFMEDMKEYDCIPPDSGEPAQHSQNSAGGQAGE